MKYIIEIEDEPFGRNDDPNIPHGMDELYRAKGFNSLVFDRFGLDKLTSLNEALDEAFQKGHHAAWVNVGECEDRVAKQAYQKGLDDAWECARKISLMSPDEIEKVFPGAAKYNRYNLGYSGVEAYEKLKAYEQQKDEIKVGDEVCFVFAGGETIEPFIVFSIKDDNGNKYYNGIQTSDGRWVSGGLKYFKTGRHFPQVAELLKAMKGGDV